MWQYVRVKFSNVTKDTPFLVVQLLLGEQAGSDKRGWKHRAIFTDMIHPMNEGLLTLGAHAQ